MLITTFFYCYLTSRLKRASWGGLGFIKCQGGLKWQHSNSYLVPHPTNLFCQSIPILANSNMLSIFNPLFFLDIEGAHTPTWFSLEQGHSVSYLRHGVIFLIKAFLGKKGDKLLWENLWGVILHKRVMIRSRQGRVLTNAFSSNLNTTDLNIFPCDGGLYKLENKTLTSLGNYEKTYSWYI